MPKPNDLPPSAKQWRFIYRYVHERDLAKAAQYAGFDGTDGPKLYRRLRKHIDKSLEVFDREQAKLSAKANSLTVDLLDQELLHAVKVSASKSGPTKVKAIELAYERLGLRRDGNFIAPPTDPANTPTIYRALERVTVTREREVRSVTAPEQAPALPASSAPTIEAPISAGKPPVEILDY